MTSTFAAYELPAPQEGSLMIAVIVNGAKILFPDTEPYIDENGRTLVPVRFVSEKLGGKVEWNNDTRTVGITYEDKVIAMQLDNKVVTINNEAVTLDSAAVMYEGRTMVPLRFVSETLNATVTWDGPANAVQVSDKLFLAKVESGEVKLDMWGRTLGVPTEDWNTLIDLPEAAYKTEIDRSDKDFLTNIEYFSWKDIFTTKSTLDRSSNIIREYYRIVLNVDYRTIDEESFIPSIYNLIGKYTNGAENKVVVPLRAYVKFVKENHVIAKGYADPEPSLARLNYFPIMRSHFKFMIIQSDDKYQNILDTFDVIASDKFDAIKGKWYSGYSDVRLTTNAANYQEEHLGITVGLEEMFKTGRNHYEVIE